MLLNCRVLLVLFAAAVLLVSPNLPLAEGGGVQTGNNSNGSSDGVANGGGGDSNYRIGNKDKDTASDGGTNNESGTKNREYVGSPQDKVLNERQLGRVISLKAALRIVNATINGRVIDVDLMEHCGKLEYRVKVRRDDGLIRTLNLDARTGKVISWLGARHAYTCR